MLVRKYQSLTPPDHTVNQIPEVHVGFVSVRRHTVIHWILLPRVDVATESVPRSIVKKTLRTC